MRIGILTLPLHTNYGGILQAYALQTVLERMGHEVKVIQKERERLIVPIWKIPFVYPFRAVRKLTWNKEAPIFFEKIMEYEYPIITQHIQRFIDSYIHLHLVKKLDDIKETDFDAIVVGSDQVWRPCYFKLLWKRNIEDAFLKFAKGWAIKRVAYAASFGTDSNEYSNEEISAVSELLKAFDAVSVREASGVKLCNDYFNIPALHVLDPTLLLDEDDYENLISQARLTESKNTYLLEYFLDPTEDKRKLVAKISAEKGLGVFKAITQEGKSVEEKIKIPVEEWLNGFRNANFIVTDSFHACVFSIIFRKPFVVVGNVERGMSRFTSLLDSTGLMGNLIMSCGEYDSDKDYSIQELASKRILEKKLASKHFLKEVL